MIEACGNEKEENGRELSRGLFGWKENKKENLKIRTSCPKRATCYFLKASTCKPPRFLLEILPNQLARLLPPDYSIMSSVTSIISTVSALLLFTGAFFTIMLKVDLAPHFYASTAVKLAICLCCLILLFAGEYYDSDNLLNSHRLNSIVGAVLILLYCYRREKPQKFILLGFFTVCINILMGSICAFIANGNVMLQGAIVMAVQLVSLTLYTFCIAGSSFDCRALGPFVFFSFMALIYFRYSLPPQGFPISSL